MATAQIEFLSPVGRLVQGDPFTPDTTNMQGQPLTTREGKPRESFLAVLAVEKNALGPNGRPVIEDYYQKLVAFCRQAWPQFYDAQGNCTHPQMSMKFADGDGVDGFGKPNNTKEGFAGHWIIKTSSSFAPRVFYAGRYGAQDEIRDKNLLKRGYYVRVSGTIVSNNNPQKPGVYVNLGLVELVATGQVISSGPDAAAVFGGQPAAALPAGAVALPAGGMPMGNGLPVPGAGPTGFAQPAAMPGMPGAPMGAVHQPAPPAAHNYVQPNPGMMAGPGGAMPAPQGYAAPAGMPGMPGMPGLPQQGYAAPAGMPGMPGLPQAGYAAPGGMPAPMGMPPAAQPIAMPPAGPQLTPHGVATGLSYQQMIANGWTDATLRSGGYLL